MKPLRERLADVLVPNEHWLVDRTELLVLLREAAEALRKYEIADKAPPIDRQLTKGSEASMSTYSEGFGYMMQCEALKATLEVIRSKAVAVYPPNSRPYDQGRHDAFNECAEIAAVAISALKK